MTSKNRISIKPISSKNDQYPQVGFRITRSSCLSIESVKKLEMTKLRWKKIQHNEIYMMSFMNREIAWLSYLRCKIMLFFFHFFSSYLYMGDSH